MIFVLILNKQKVFILLISLIHLFVNFNVNTNSYEHTYVYEI
jgi:hypothetical protein